MFIIPDFSYFAVPGFINKMCEYTNRSSSIIFHNKSGDSWDNVLCQKDAYLMTWLHNKTDKIHNVFFPYSPNKEFLLSSYTELINLIEPVIPRIKNYLLALEYEDVSDYMNDSKNWLPILFGIKQYYFSAELAAQYFGLRQDSFPIILIWTDINKKELVLISPNKCDENMTEYVKSLYWCITKATQQSRKKRLNVQELKKAIEEKFSESYHIQEYSQKVEFIDIIESPKSVADSLTDIGNQYKEYFDDAILNFEDYINTEGTLTRKNIIDLCNKSKNELVFHLTENGFQKIREGRNHEIWQHPKLKKPTPVPRHNKLTPFVLKSIQKDIEIATA